MLGEWVEESWRAGDVVVDVNEQGWYMTRWEGPEGGGVLAIAMLEREQVMSRV